MKKTKLSIPLILGAVLALFGFPRVKQERETNREGIESKELSHAYDRVSRMPQFQTIRRFFVRKLAQYGPHGTLVDVGCGPGYLLAEIAQAFPHLKLIGVDISEEMVAAARENLAAKGLADRAEFRVGAAQQLPFPDESVDFVVSSLSLHHWSEPEAAFKEIHRILKPGGQFLVLDGRRDTRRAFYWILLFAREFIVPQAIKEANEPPGSIAASYTPTEINEILSQSPFTFWQVDGSIGWMFIWGRKGAEASERQAA